MSTPLIRVWAMKGTKRAQDLGRSEGGVDMGVAIDPRVEGAAPPRQFPRVEGGSGHARPGAGRRSGSRPRRGPPVPRRCRQVREARGLVRGRGQQPDQAAGRQVGFPHAPPRSASRQVRIARIRGRPPSMAASTGRAPPKSGLAFGRVPDPQDLVGEVEFQRPVDADHRAEPEQLVLRELAREAGFARPLPGALRHVGEARRLPDVEPPGLGRPGIDLSATALSSAG
jgi:hypothetical protein